MHLQRRHGSQYNVDIKIEAVAHSPNALCLIKSLFNLINKIYTTSTAKDGRVGSHKSDWTATEYCDGLARLKATQ